MQGHHANQHSFLRAPYAALAIPLFAAASALALWALLPPQQVLALLTEDGAVERLSAILYLVLALAVWFLRPSGQADWPLWLALSVLFAAFGARELDLHKAWTGTSVLKFSFYLRDAAPLHQKLAAFVSVVSALLAAAYLARRLLPSFWQGLRRQDPVALSVACFAATMVISKVFDRSINILAEDYGLHFSVSVHALVSALEEILELGLPLIAGLALLQNRREPARAPSLARR